MEYSFAKENREFLRVKAQLTVRYRFLSEHRTGPEFQVVFKGKSDNLSGGGFLLQGRIPDESWIPDLLVERIMVGVEIVLPDKQEPVRALARAAWVETVDQTTLECRLGLKFREITRRHQDRLFQFVIENHLQ